MEQVIYWNAKIVQYGKYFEFSRYSKIFKQNFKKTAVVVVKNAEKTTKGLGERFLFSLNRTKKNLKMLASENFTHQFSSFATLTFAENVVNLTDANLCFKTFVRKLRAYDKDLKYLAVPEFQKRGAVHYHVVLRSRFIPRKVMRRCWNYGFYNLHSLRSVKHISLYLAKYMQKGIMDARLSARKAYFSSKNLIRPLVIKWLSAFPKDSARLFPLMHRLSSFEALTEFAGELKFILYEGSSNYLFNKIYARKLESYAHFQ